MVQFLVSQGKIKVE